ncbi:alcohol dehydrogenase catalytic domain-containing protein [Streptomyces sp. NPDC048527]|uniref:alcohol dehydrogenase catalytic domain-containing protein n=1 Tax=Streptomyces sp. NPDC048527 TaxID=3365568 RepID=UPI0037190453
MGDQTSYKFCDVPIPEAGPGEVTIKVGGSGACQSDLHHEMASLDQVPFSHNGSWTIGHEPAGCVDSIGAGVKGFSIGDPVLVCVL